MIAFLIAAAVFSGQCGIISAGAQNGGANAYPEDFAWATVSSPVTDNLNSVDMVSANEGWAVGENGTVLHYDGMNWTQFSAPVTATTRLDALSMSSAVNGWAIGQDNTPPFYAIILRWNGTAWEAVPVPSPPWPVALQDVSVPNESSAWIGGGVFVCALGPPPCTPEAAFGTILHWDGNEWIFYSIANTFLSSISMLSDTDGWAVGVEVDQTTKQQRSRILHWNGISWTAVDHPITEYPAGNIHFILEEVSALNANTAWSAVSGNHQFLRWDGTSWTAFNSPVSGRPSIAVLSSDNAWAVGDEGDIGHWDGHFWNSINSPVTSTLTAVSMVSAFDGWAVGNGGVLLHGSQAALHFYLPCVSK